MSQNKQKTLVLIDSNALVHRAFHALPSTLRNRAGQMTNAVFGFTTMFLNAVKELQPDYLIAAFDVDKETFRHKDYKEYKAQRVAAPQELYDQIPLVEEVLNSFKVPVLKQKGYEADDVVGTLAIEGVKKGLRVLIVTGDLDTLQLVEPSIGVYTLRKGFSDTVTYDAKKVKEKLGLKPEQVVDYKALKGDPSDNIPGVAGIGEKTAIELLQKLGTLDEVIKEAEKKDSKIPEKTRKKILTDKEAAQLSRKLAQIVTDLKLKLDLKQAQFGDYDPYKVLDLFQKLGFRSLINRIPKLKPQKMNLFDTKQRAEGKRKRAEFQSEIIDTKEQLEKLVVQLERQKEFAIDLETTSLNPIDAELVGVAIAFENKKSYYIPVGHREGKQLPVQKVFQKLQPLVESKKIGKVGHHLKYDCLVWQNNFPGSAFGKISFDTLLAAYLLDPDNRQNNLDDLVFLELGYRMQPIEDLIGKGPLRRSGSEVRKKQLSFAQVPIKQAAFYAGEDALFAWKLRKALEQKLKEVHETKTFKRFTEHYHLSYKLNLESEAVTKITSPYEVLQKIELPLIPVLAAMEKEGIELNTDVLKKLSTETNKQIGKLEEKIYHLAGRQFNIRSPQQLKEILFEKLKISTEEVKKTKTGFSTAASELAKLKGKHPIIKLIVEHRELSKLKSTYLDTLPNLINPYTKRLHTSFNQAIAATGRLTSSDPNLQNIPSRTELGEKIRQAFQAKPGCKLLSVDYSQIELRVVACIAKETEMLKHFQKKQDIHTATAMKIFGVKEQEVTGAMRRQAKIVNFGILYGVSAFGLAQQTDVDRHKAKELIENYFKAFPKIREYIESVKKLAQKQGYVETIFGRRRYLANINSSMPVLKNAAERTAINLPIQGSAADIMKLAMIELFYQLNQRQLKSKMLLQVHDEILLEVPEAELKKVASLAKQVMESVVHACVLFEADVKEGKNWGEMKVVNS
jgi:DNA polymerase-1